MLYPPDMSRFKLKRKHREVKSKDGKELIVFFIYKRINTYLDLLLTVKQNPHFFNYYYSIGQK